MFSSQIRAQFSELQHLQEAIVEHESLVCRKLEGYERKLGARQQVQADARRQMTETTMLKMKAEELTAIVKTTS